MDWLWSANLVTGAFMAGVVAFVHVVHYPLFREVDPSAWRSYHLQHIRRTTWLIAPAMLLDALAAIGLLLYRPDAASLIALVCVLLAWIITFALAVPAHNRMGTGFDTSMHRKLMWSNLLRLGAWIARLAVLLDAPPAQIG